jgi:hypothetical protein
VTIDRLVIAREQWRFTGAAELAFASAESPEARYRGVAAWAQRHELPRRAFFRVTREAKPCFVDFSSTAFVENFCHLVRGSDALSVSEMLPDLEDLWLTDAAGARYTAELRLAMVDPMAWRDPHPRPGATLANPGDET